MTHNFFNRRDLIGGHPLKKDGIRATSLFIDPVFHSTSIDFSFVLCVNVEK